MLCMLQISSLLSEQEESSFSFSLKDPDSGVVSDSLSIVVGAKTLIATLDAMTEVEDSLSLLMPSS